MAALEDLIGALDGTVGGMPLYAESEAPANAEPPYLTYAMKLTQTVYAGDEPLFRRWRYDVTLWQSQTDRDLVAAVISKLDSVGIYGEAFRSSDESEAQQYTTIETTVVETN